MSEPLLTLVVYGTPGTAGSKSAFPIYAGSGSDRRFTGRINVAEKDKGHRKANWRQSVINAAHADIVDITGRLFPPYPLDEAVTLSLTFTVAKPTSAPKRVRTWPIARPDALKYARAFEDALTAAGVLKDDARIVAYTRLAKVYPLEDLDALEAPGAVCKLWRLADLLDWQREAVAAPTVGTLFDVDGAS